MSSLAKQVSFVEARKAAGHDFNITASKFSNSAINNNNQDSNSKNQRQNASSPENFQANYDEVRDFFSQLLFQPFQLFQEKFEPSVCATSLECSKLNFPCIKCAYDLSCLYGEQSTVACEVKSNVQCKGDKHFQR